MITIAVSSAMCSPPEVYVQALYDFDYRTEDGKKVWMREAEEFLLLKKTNGDWWQVIRDGDKRPFYAPANYLEEISQPGLPAAKQRKRASPLGPACSAADVSSNGAVTISVSSLPDFCSPPLVAVKRGSEKVEPKARVRRPLVPVVQLAASPPRSEPPKPLPAKPKPVGQGQPPPKVEIHSQFIVANPVYTVQHTTLLGKANCKKDLNVPEHGKDVATKNEKEKDNRLITEELDKNRKNKELVKATVKEDKAKKPKISPPQQRPPSPIYANFPLISSPTPPSPQLREFPLRCLDSSWAEFEDAQGRKYYYNYTTKERSWKPPRRKSENSSKPPSVSSSKDSSPQPDSESDDKDINLHSPTPESVRLPPGWIRKYDKELNEVCYINDLTKERWLTSTDDCGRIYYFQENASESFWQLPEVVITEGDSNSKNKLSTRHAASSSSLTNSQTGAMRPAASPPKSVSPHRRPLSVANRGSKTRSMVITDTRFGLRNEPKEIRSSTLPKSLTSHAIADTQNGLLSGCLNVTKLSDGGKRLRKNWSIIFVALRESSMAFYKDAKSMNKPEFSIDLAGSTIEWAAEKSSRKNVFQITSRSGMQFLLQEEEAKLAMQWFDNIKHAIDLLPVKKLEIIVLDSSTKLNIGPSPEESKKAYKISRSKSTKRIDMDGSGSSSTEDLDCSQNEKKTRIRDKLKSFFIRRPTMESLQEKGIIKEEPVFGSSLHTLCSKDKAAVPKFVSSCISAIENKDMHADGLYRACGNLSQVQKIRFQVNQDNFEILRDEEDIHVLTGALKMFFRELKEPLFPFSTFQKFFKANGLQDRSKKLYGFRDLIHSLPKPNFHTLQFLLEHLLRVTKDSDKNRMHIQNLAIVFGPTLMWPANGSENIALDVIHQNQIIEFLLLEYGSIFR